MKRILVISQKYPNNDGEVGQMFVHTRNKAYVESGIEVVELSFSAKECYQYDGIKVKNVSWLKRTNERFDALIIHAPNIRNHLRLLLMYGKRFNTYIFFFHGQEIMKTNHDYPLPYEFKKKNIFRYQLYEIYDYIKLKIWKKYLPHVSSKSQYIFVSNWMKEIFEKNIGIEDEELKRRVHVIYNSVGKIFENNEYSDGPKEYDFITVRANLDESKYAIDLVCKIAEYNPKHSFLIIGKGKFFEYYNIPSNVIWKNQTMQHEELLCYLQKARCALMPTRTDAQGLMMCEISAIGMPLITSDIPVCHEVLDGLKNVFFIENEKLVNLSLYLEKKYDICKSDRYYAQNTIDKEIVVIKNETGERK